MIGVVVRSACKDVLNKCRQDFLLKANSAASGKDTLSGIEAIFHEAFISHFGNGAARSGWQARSKVKLAALSGSLPSATQRAGYMDAVLERDGQKFGLEFKVVQLPRSKNLSPNRSLYDLGQITWDHTRIRLAKDLSGGFCLAVVYGSLLDAKNVTETNIQGALHDMLFVDYTRSRFWGELSEPDQRKERKQQLISLREIGLDKPFDTTRNSQSHDFCVVHLQRDIGVVGYWSAP
jgi:hypothetical protein